MWGILFLCFIGLWLLQIWLTSRQVKHYRKTVHEMSDYPSGYLGVGIEKKRFGKGTVMIVVSDDQGTVIDCKMMSGVTVFSKFNKCKRFIGAQLDTTIPDVEEDLQKVFLMAVQKIKEQMHGKKLEKNTA